MKKGILILLSVFIMVSSIEAKHRKKSPNRISFNYSYQNSVNFEEQGIEFFIFTNGKFDFNTNFNNSNNNYYGNHINREREISRDYKGQITRIGNSFIHYDRYGNVIRIGNVYMRYYRGKLTGVGHLKVSYDYWGNPTFYGSVKNNYYNYNGFRINLNIGDICSYNDAYFYGNDFTTNYSRIREDYNYYYYRANPNAKTGKRSKTLRRRKPTSTTLKNTPTRSSNTAYRRPTSLNTKRITTPVKRSNNTIYRKPTSVNAERVATPIIRNTNTSYTPHSSVTNRSVKPVKRNTNSANKRSNIVKRNVVNTTRQKVGVKDRSVIIRRN